MFAPSNGLEANIGGVVPEPERMKGLLMKVH
jgi:hypothetical protein